MKILMTADAAGGIWRYSLDLAAELQRRGDEIVLAIMGPRPSPAQREEAARIPGVRLAESDFALEWMQNPWHDVERSMVWLRALANEFEADLIHLNGYAHAAAEWDRPVVVVAHSCVASWWRAVHLCAPGPEWAEYRSRVSAGLAGASAVVAPTAFMAQALQEEYPHAVASVQVIHNFSRAPRYPGGEKQPTGLAAGRLWDQAKNLHLLDRVAVASKWRIQVAGPAIDPQTGTPLKTGLELLGPMQHSELLKRMRQAALFLHPAVYEPFGLSVLEAARSGCCLVLSDIAPLRELWEGAAVFLDPFDPDAWAREIAGLSESPERVQHLGALACERSARYSGFAAAWAYQCLYRSLLSPNCLQGAAA